MTPELLLLRLAELWREIDAAIAAGDWAATREAEDAWLAVYDEYLRTPEQEKEVT